MQLNNDLLFVDADGVETVIPITECVGMDAYADKLKQPSGRFGRDKTIGADDIPLTFWKGLYNYTGNPLNLPDGSVVYELTMGFDQLLHFSDAARNGFEAVVFLRTYLGDTIYVNGQIDFPESVTDEATFITANIVQDTKLALIERRNDITTDVFAAEDIDGNTVVPLARTKYLQRALAVVQSSELATQTELNTTYISYGADAILFQPAQRIDKSGIEYTYNPFNQFEYLQPGYGNAQVIDAFSRFKILIAAEELTNLEITLKNVSFNVLDQSGLGTNKVLQVSWGASPLEGEREGEHEFIPTTTQSFVSINNADYTFTIPKVFRGHAVWLMGQAIARDPSISGTPSGSTSINASIEKIFLKTSSLAIDSVIYAVRYEEYLKTGVRNIAQLPLSCPVYEPSGKYSNLFVFNGNMQRLKEKPFNFQFKDRFGDEIRLMGCNDYQINSNGVEIASYSEFYPNIELESFENAGAPEDIERSFNPRFQINKVEINFSKYEKSEDAKNTVESFHTKSQYMPPNKQVENKIELTFNMIADGFKQERDRRLAIRETTALESDNEISILDSVMLAPGTIGTFTSFLFQDLQGGVVYIYNIAIDSGIEAVFRWTQLGLEVGDYFAFDSGIYGNAEHTVIEISDNLIKLQPTNYVPGKLGNATFVFRYYYNNIEYTQRFDQGVDFVEGVSAPDRTANLRLSIGNLLSDPNWTSYLNTICSAYPSGIIKNTEFINNGTLTTQYLGGAVIREDANLIVADFDDKILNVNQYKTRVLCSFDRAVALFSGTMKGFVRVQNAVGKVLKLHIADCAMVWQDDVLEIDRGEQRNESEFTTIDFVGNGDITINQTGYPMSKLGGKWYDINPLGYLKIYDTFGRNVITPVLFSEVLVNGVKYEVKADFVNALNG